MFAVGILAFIDVAHFLVGEITAIIQAVANQVGTYTTSTGAQKLFRIPAAILGETLAHCRVLIGAVRAVWFQVAHAVVIDAVFVAAREVGSITEVDFRLRIRRKRAHF